jgi:MYXO-CTERM domain-containing protein
MRARACSLAIAVVCLVVALSRPASAQGTWTKAPNNPNNGGGAFGLWLLTDGTVLSHGDALNHWMILTPDKKGNYANGTWKNVAGSTHARSGATQHVLKDGRFFQAGGEYIDGPECTAALCPTAEIYDPIANKWTDAATAPYEIADTGSATLADGRLIYSSRANANIQIYDPTTNTWTKSGTMPLVSGDENAWATLQNGGILAVGYQTGGAVIYNPATDTWKRTGMVPSGFNTGDTGGITQMFDGRVFVYGLNYHSYIYTPGATADDPGSWVEGPKLLDAEAEDEYSDILPTGQVMGGLVHVMFGAGTILQLFDPTSNTVSQATPPPDTGNQIPIDYVNLPNGQVMVTAGNADWILTPSGAPNDDWRPVVTSVAYNASAGNYTLTGMQISGLVNGADEGDDMTMAENYPIVWLTDAAGNVYNCRSFNFSSMFPSKGSTPETCDFTTPATLPAGSYSLYVSAVGVPSKDPFPFTVGQSSSAGGAAGGSSASGGSGGTAGVPGTGGMAGAAATGGHPGTGGSGGVVVATGGHVGTGGVGTGGLATGGASGEAGRGGSPGSAGEPGSGGSGAGGSSGTGGSGDKTGGGCSCTTAGGPDTGAAALVLLAGLLAMARRRARGQR